MLPNPLAVTEGMHTGAVILGVTDVPNDPGKLFAIVVVTCPVLSVDRKELFLWEFVWENKGNEPGIFAHGKEFVRGPGADPNIELDMELGMEFTTELGGMGFAKEFGTDAGKEPGIGQAVFGNP
jgi:hypothetical protein